MAFTTEEQIAPYANKYGFTFEEGMTISVYVTNENISVEQQTAEHITGLTTEQIMEQGLRIYATQLGSFKELCIVGGNIPVAADVTGGWVAQGE